MDRQTDGREDRQVQQVYTEWLTDSVTCRWTDEKTN